MAARALDPRAREFFPAPKLTYHYRSDHYQCIYIPQHLTLLGQPSPSAPPAYGCRPHEQDGGERRLVGCRNRGRNKQYHLRRKNDQSWFGFGRSPRPTVARSRRTPRVGEAFSVTVRGNVLRRSGGENSERVSHKGHLQNQKHHLMVAGEVHGDRERTTVMIRNIPNRYTREMLKEFLDEHCSAENEKQEHGEDSSFDFLYLPIDFRTKLNKGYAFVNFTSPEAVGKFFEAANGKDWPDHFRSPKIREICYARIQGKRSLVSHFERMEFPCRAFQAVMFEPARDGSGKVVDEICVGICGPKLLDRWIN